MFVSFFLLRQVKGKSMFDFVSPQTAIMTNVLSLSSVIVVYIINGVYKIVLTPVSRYALNHVPILGTYILNFLQKHQIVTPTQMFDGQFKIKLF